MFLKCSAGEGQFKNVDCGLPLPVNVWFILFIFVLFALLVGLSCFWSLLPILYIYFHSKKYSIEGTMLGGHQSFVDLKDMYSIELSFTINLMVNNACCSSAAI